MKRSEINKAVTEACYFFKKHGWVLPPHPKWDVTDFGLGVFSVTGLVLVNLAEEAEYCEKIMYAAKQQLTPCHIHRKKKEDIICRSGVLVVQLWITDPAKNVERQSFKVNVNGDSVLLISGDEVRLEAGERITIEPGIWHAFYADSDGCMIGEVSTANDDLNDNFFSDKNVGRFSEIIEDEAPLLKLLSEI
jgi:D-lyxose ketol-isomerase